MHLVPVTQGGLKAVALEEPWVNRATSCGL